VFRHCFPEAASKLATRLCDYAHPIEPQICLRSSEHASTARPEGVLSLAASGFAPGSNPDRTKKTLIPVSLRKTAVYNTPGKPGQTHDRGIRGIGEQLPGLGHE